MKKDKLIRTLVLSVLSCGLLLLSVMVLQDMNEKKAVLDQATTSFSPIENIEEPVPINGNEDLFAREKVTVMICEGCKLDVIALVPERALKKTDWNSFILESGGIPAWISGKGTIPFVKNMNCSNLSDLYSQGMYAANQYRDGAMALKNGASLTMVSKSGKKVFKSGSKEHTKIQKNLYDKMNLSFKTTLEVVKKMKKSNCIKSKKK